MTCEGTEPTVPDGASIRVNIGQSAGVRSCARSPASRWPRPATTKGESCPAKRKPGERNTRLHTHPAVMAQRAAGLAPIEALMWEHDVEKRMRLGMVRDQRREAIDDTLSAEIVRIHDDGHNPPDYP